MIANGTYSRSRDDKRFFVVRSFVFNCRFLFFFFLVVLVVFIMEVFVVVVVDDDGGLCRRLVVEVVYV